MFDNNDIKRFFGKSIKDNKTGCWEWQGYKNKAGYGYIKVKRKPYVAHRLSWMIHNGDIPEGMLICHHCDNPGCVNPEHLFVGTSADNSNDMVMKGRSAKPKGEQNNNAILTNTQVNEIRLLLMKRTRTAVEIAKIFNISGGTVRLIDTGELWTHVKMSNGLPFKGRKTRKTKFLSLDEVIEIKKILGVDKKTTFPTIGKAYGVDRMTINRIATGATWSQIEVELPNGSMYSCEKRSYKRSKVSEDDVRKIKQLIYDGELSYSGIAKLFPVSRANVGAIAVGKTWGDVFITLDDGSKFYHKRHSKKTECSEVAV